jgi:hypothetical protein
VRRSPDGSHGKEAVDLAFARSDLCDPYESNDRIPRTSRTVCRLGNAASRADPARGSRKLPPAPANPRERRESLNDLAAPRTDVLPFHREQAELACVQEQVDDCHGRELALLRETDGVDAHKLVVTRSSDEPVEHIDELYAAGDRSTEPLEPVP